VKKLFWHFLSNRWNSAITEYAISCARANLLQGVDVHFFPLRGSPAERRTVDLMATTSISGFGLDSLPMLLSAARRTKPDVIFTYGGPETVLAGIISRVTNTKVIRFRGEAIRSSSVLYRWRQRLSLDALDMIMAPSQRLASELSAIGVKAPIESITLGCDTARFYRPDSVAAISEDRPIILIFGRLDPVKGHSLMIQRMAQILALWGDKPRKPALHIVGEPANVTVAQLEEETRKAKLTLGSDVVISTLRVDNVAGLLASAALGVVPSLGSEIICRVAQEFLLCGTPVAVSGAGSLPEVLFDDAGFCFNGQSIEADIEAFTNWISRSLNESAELKVKRAKRARAFYSFEAMADRLSQVFRSHFGWESVS
jgi:glycosyltransferase involved in cell wall biosynthesis